MKNLFWIIVVAFIMWTGASIAMADTIPPSPVTATDWRGILSVIGVSLGGLGIFLSGAAKLLHAVAPLTKTTLDDRAAAKLDQVAEVVYAVRDHVLGLVKMASGPQQAQPEPVPAPALAVVPNPRNPQAGRARVTVLVLVALAIGVPVAALLDLNAGCATLKSDGKAVGSAIVDCTGGGMFGIAQQVLDTIRAWDRAKPYGCMDADKLDWGCVYDKAIAKGKEIGGCALAKAVSSSPPAASFLAPDPGRAALERFRASFGGTVQWQTDAGVM